MRPITNAECVAHMEALLTCRDPRYGLLWRLGTVTGLRISDLLRLRKKDLGSKNLTVTEQKSGKVKKIEFSEATVTVLNEFMRAHPALQSEDYVFYRRPNRRDVPMSRQWARTVIALTARSIGLVSIGAHSMRKIYAYTCYHASERKFEAVQRALNHSRVETTLEHYLKGVI